MWHHVAIDQLPFWDPPSRSPRTGGATLRGLLPRLALELQKALQQHKAPSSEVLDRWWLLGRFIIWFIKKAGTQQQFMSYDYLIIFN